MRIISKRQHKGLLKRADHCAWCKTTENLTIDHIVPLSKGGSNRTSNLQLLCSTCNGNKGDAIDYGAVGLSRQKERRGLKDMADQDLLALYRTLYRRKPRRQRAKRLADIRAEIQRRGMAELADASGLKPDYIAGSTPASPTL